MGDVGSKARSGSYHRLEPSSVCLSAPPSGPDGCTGAQGESLLWSESAKRRAQAKIDVSAVREKRRRGLRYVIRAPLGADNRGNGWWGIWAQILAPTRGGNQGVFSSGWWQLGKKVPDSLMGPLHRAPLEFEGPCRKSRS